MPNQLDPTPNPQTRFKKIYMLGAGIVFIIAILSVYFLKKPQHFFTGNKEPVSFTQFKKNIAQRALAAGASPEIIKTYLSSASTPPNIKHHVGQTSTPQTATTTARHTQQNPHPVLHKPAIGSFAYYWQHIQHNCPPNQLAKKYAPLRTDLQEIEKVYHVPMGYVLGIWCTESKLGDNIGHKALIPSLLKQAYYNTARQRFFSQQLIDALVVLSHAPHPVAAYTISTFDGGMGQTQFEPSSYLDYAVHFIKQPQTPITQASQTKHPEKNYSSKSQPTYPDYPSAMQQFSDLWHNPLDALASAAHYLAAHGWQDEQPCWGYRARLLPGANWQRLADSHLTLAIETWRLLGAQIKTQHQSCKRQDLQLVMNHDTDRQAFLVYPNFKVFHSWNPRLQEGLIIALLHDLYQPIIHPKAPKIKLSRYQRPSTEHGIPFRNALHVTKAPWYIPHMFEGALLGVQIDLKF